MPGRDPRAALCRPPLCHCPPATSCLRCHPWMPAGSWGRGTLGAPQPHAGGAGGEMCSPRPRARPGLTNPNGREDGDRDSPSLLRCHPCGTGVPLYQAARWRRWIWLPALVPRQQHPGLCGELGACPGWGGWSGCVPRQRRLGGHRPRSWPAAAPSLPGHPPPPFPNKSRK